MFCSFAPAVFVYFFTFSILNVDHRDHILRLSVTTKVCSQYYLEAICVIALSILICQKNRQCPFFSNFIYWTFPHKLWLDRKLLPRKHEGIEVWGIVYLTFFNRRHMTSFSISRKFYGVYIFTPCWYLQMFYSDNISDNIMFYQWI